MLSDGLRRLSNDSVQRRFLTPKRSFSRAELRYRPKWTVAIMWRWWPSTPQSPFAA